MPSRLHFSAHESRTAGKGEPFAVLRPVKPQPAESAEIVDDADGGGFSIRTGVSVGGFEMYERIMAPLTPGTVVAGKEAWELLFGISENDDITIRYLSDGHEEVFASETMKVHLRQWALDHLGWFGDKHHAQRMPLWAVRHWLRVESVRAVRVGELVRVTTDDANGMLDWNSRYSRLGAAFRWEANPWAWLIQLSKAARPEG